MMTTDDLFDFPTDMFDSTPEREPGDFLRIGRYNRPSVRKPVWIGNRWYTDTTTEERVDYPRVTTIVDQLSAGPGLTYWKVQHVALAVAKASRGTRLAIAGKEYKDPFLKTFIDKALEQAKHNEKADLGTTVGRLIEPGAPRDILDPEEDADLIAEVTGFDEAMERHGFRIVDTQFLCVNDFLKNAGTGDILVQLPDPYSVTFADGRVIDASGAVVVLDCKRTSGTHPVSWGIQVASYARSMRYDPETEERFPLHEKLDNRIGLIAHINPATGHCEMLVLDLEIGWELAKLAQVMYTQGLRGQSMMITAPLPYQEVEDLILVSIKQAQTQQILRKIYLGIDDDRKDVYVDAVIQRRKELNS